MNPEVERRSCRVLLLRFHPEAFYETSIFQPMKILVTGDREWTDKEMIAHVLGLWVSSKDTVIHGAANGADTLAGKAAKALGATVIPFPADWDKFGKAAGPIRNRKMLDEKPDVVLAFHDDLKNSKGTKDCCKEARKRGLVVLVHFHHPTIGWSYDTLK